MPVFLAVLYSFGPLSSPVLAEEESSLLYADPFDEITLNDENHKAALRVFPLELPNRRVPKAPDPTDELELKLKDHPDQFFKVQWKDIKKVRLFEQMLLDEAARLVAAGKFDEAYEYYEQLEARYPNAAGVKAGVESYLWSDAQHALDDQRDEQALALLTELRRRNSQYEGLAESLAKVTARRVEQSIKDQSFRAARGLLRNLKASYPQESAETVARYEKLLQGRAQALKAKAEGFLKAGQTAQAWRAANTMLEVWPALAGGRELARKIHADYPTLVVAVSEGAPQADVATFTTAWPQNLLDDWDVRRARRLLVRDIAELQSAGPNGGQYAVPWGTLERRKDSAQLALRLRTGKPGVRGLSAADVATCLVRLADPAHPSNDRAFAEMFVGANVEGLDSLSIELRSTVAAPEGWLARTLSTLAASDALPSVAPYKIAARSPREVRFTAQPGYALAEPGQPREIVERSIADGKTAISALRGGQVGAVARLSPWEAATLKSGDELVVEPYALPTVHCLVPNQRKPRLANRTLRRALEYAIDRRGILERALLAGRTSARSQVISGPFPQGDNDDPHAYAYNSKVQPRPYDLTMARVLVQMARDEAAAASDGQASEPAEPLVLVHPPEPAARVACLSIRRQLQAAGVEVTLREQPSGKPLGDDFDLCYLELAMQEPAIDVWRLLGPGSLVGASSPYLDQALGELLSATTWKQVCQRLRDIHELVHAEVDVIPLWQLEEHFAYQPGVKGIGSRPIGLYDHVEHWEIELRAPGE